MYLRLALNLQQFYYLPMRGVYYHVALALNCFTKMIASLKDIYTHKSIFS